VIKLLKERMQGMPNAPVLSAVPDVRTLEADLERVGVAFRDERGRRLDFHALRHAFVSSLDQAGASQATKRS
jgi:hypothetical protein